MSIVVWLVTIVIGIISWTALKIYLNYCKVSHIPGSWQVIATFWKVPIISPFLHMNNQRSLTELIRDYGDKKEGIVRVSSSDRNLVIITDKDLLKEVIITKGSTFVKFPEVYEVFRTFGDNILTILDASSESWRNHHKICSPAFTTQNLEYLCEYSAKAVDLLETRWKKLESSQILKDGKKYDNSYITSDIKGDFSDVTLSVLGNVGFGLDFEIFNQTEGSEGQLFRKSLEVLFTTGVFVKLFIGMSTMWKIFYPLAQKLFKVDLAYNVVSSKLDQIIKERTVEIEQRFSQSGELKDEKSERRDLLSCLIEANFVQKGVLTNEEIKSDAFIFSLAGHETTSTTLQWTCYELAKREDIQKKVREEVDLILENGNKRATYDDFPKMNYLNMIIMESLRMHPPVGAGFRVAKKATTIGKYQIPKDTVVEINIANTHWNEKFWTDANSFNPERMPTDFEERQKIHNDFTWLPFSMGNRKCIGYKFAQYEAFAIMSRILQLYEIRLVNDETLPQERVTEEKGPTVGPGNLRLLFTRR